MEKNKMIYRILIRLFSLFMLLGAITYFAQYDMVAEMFTSLGVPTEVIYPLAVLKILGIIAILFIPNSLLKKLAFLGFALDLIMAIIAHLNAGDGGFYGPIIPLVLLSGAYYFYRKL